MKNPEKTYINCPFVDCDELVDITDIIERDFIIEPQTFSDNK